MNNFQVFFVSSFQFKREAQWVLLDPLTGRTIERGESDVSRPELKVAAPNAIPDLVQAVHGNGKQASLFGIEMAFLI